MSLTYLYPPPECPLLSYPDVSFFRHVLSSLNHTLHPILNLPQRILNLSHLPSPSPFTIFRRLQILPSSPKYPHTRETQGAIRIGCVKKCALLAPATISSQSVLSMWQTTSSLVYAPSSFPLFICTRVLSTELFPWLSGLWAVLWLWNMKRLGNVIWTRCLHATSWGAIYSKRH